MKKNQFSVMGFRKGLSSELPAGSYRLLCFFVILIMLVLPAAVSLSQELPSPPGEWVSDYAGILSSSQAQSLNQLLRSYEDTTSNQIVVAIFPDAQGYPVEEFSIRLAEKWRVGQQVRDNGVILAIFMQERSIRVEVGYGLEDMIPDAIAFQVTDEIMPPYFREGKYDEGIHAGVSALMAAAAGKFQGAPQTERSDDDFDFTLPILLLIFFILFPLFRRRKFMNAGSGGWKSSGPFWSGGIGSSRGSGSRGSSGGGFRGGGGSFGGGGATGRW